MPAQNPFSPAPRSTATQTSGSSSMSVNTLRRPCIISGVRELSFFGRSRVIQQTRSLTTTSSPSVMCFLLGAGQAEAPRGDDVALDLRRATEERGGDGVHAHVGEGGAQRGIPALPQQPVLPEHLGAGAREPLVQICAEELVGRGLVAGNGV